MFTPDEAQETIEIGALNGLFVLGRSLGFIGNFLITPFFQIGSMATQMSQETRVLRKFFFTPFVFF